MPLYFYHLKLELYPTSDPTRPPASDADERGDIYLPDSDASVFDDLPSHPRPDRATRRPLDRFHSYRHGPGGPATAAPLAEESLPRRSAERGVIDCGTSPARARDAGQTVGPPGEQQWPGRTRSCPPPRSTAAIRPQTAAKDWRFGRVSIETVDPAPADDMPNEAAKAGPSAAPMLGPSFGGAGTATKAECVPLETRNTELGWGVVHFYREGDESPSLGEPGRDDEERRGQDGTLDADCCTTLCIPAVPAYMTPGDLMGFVGERWMGDISHCRMVMTSRLNRYLVLFKFRDSKQARQWRREFDGKVFNSMEAQVCRVVFVKTITFETPTRARGSDKAATSSSSSSAAAAAGVSSSLKPFPPPTPNLIELPTCPVCLERMDETSGLMTIPCSHVFHCTCLQSWKGAGCPVCRFTDASAAGAADAGDYADSQAFGSPVSNLCSVCDCGDDVWVCLICGHVGCGRYKGGHAKDHWKETAHCFALELETQHVWDYAGDMWVHRLIRDKGDGKVVELPGRGRAPGFGGRGGGGGDGDDDVVPRAKLESIGLEYTHLITSQLESQRAYYEDLLSKTVDKATKAAALAESSAAQSSKTAERLAELEEQHRALTTQTLPQLERALERERGKAAKAEALARRLGRSLQEEKRVGEGLMQRIEHVGGELAAARRAAEELRAEGAELRDMNRDLSMFIAGQDKLREMEAEGRLEAGEAAGGSASVPERRGGGRKGKGKDKGRQT